MLFNKADNTPVLTEAQRAVPQLAWVDGFSRLLDTKFRIPGTDVRFGMDFLMGLVPGIGSFASLGFSALLIITMVRHGASGMLAIRMLFNVVLDALVGAVPVLGNIFDLFYKANYRNLELMREYYGEGEHQGSAWPAIIAILVVMLLLMAFSIWVLVKVFQLLF